MIPDYAVEAAARAIYEIKFGSDGWEGLPDKPRKQYSNDARFILEAAAPHMLGDAWAEGHGVGRTDEWSIEPNPYRPHE